MHLRLLIYNYNITIKIDILKHCNFRMDCVLELNKGYSITAGRQPPSMFL